MNYLCSRTTDMTFNRKRFSVNALGQTEITKWK